MTIHYTTYSPSFHEKLTSLASIIWRATYSDILKSEQIDYMLDMMYNRDQIAQQISEGHLWDLVLVNGELAGFLHYYVKEDTVMLSKIYVTPQYWGTQLSTRMLEHVEKYAQLKSKFIIELTVNKYNVRAQKFYNKNGFVNVAEAIFNIGQGYIMDDYIFQKKLQKKAHTTI